MHNLICLSFRFESHIPENVVDQMKYILVQHENLLHDKFFGRVSEKNTATSHVLAKTQAIPSRVTSEWKTEAISS